MDRQSIDKLLTICRADETAKLEAMFSGYELALDRYKKSNDPKDLKAFEAADKSLQRLADDISGRAVEQVFVGIPAAVKYLQEVGYKVKKSKIYNDVKSGLLRAEADGRSYRSGEVLAYAVRAGLKQKEDGHRALDEKAVEKSALEVDLLRIKKQRKEIALEKERGESIRKSDVIIEFATRLALLEAGVKHTVRTFAVDWIYAVGGDPKKADMLVELVFAEIDSLLTEVANLEEIGIYVNLAGEQS